MTSEVPEAAREPVAGTEHAPEVATYVRSGVAPPAAAATAEARRPRLPNFVSFVMAVGLVWLGGQFIRQGVSDNLLDDKPELAVLWQGDSSDALARLARLDLQARNPGGAARLAVKSLQFAPLNAPALTTYGLAMDTLHHHDVASRAMTLAGQRSWRDLITQVWLFRRDLVAADFTDAFNHADALLRRVPSPPLLVLRILTAAAHNPNAVGPLTDHLARNPDWREKFFIYMSAFAKPPATDVAGSLLTRLAAGPTPPSDLETGVYLASLANQGKYKEAEQTWRQLTPGAAHDSYVHNGDFERPARTTPFDWWLTNGVGWQASIGDAPDGHGKALRIDYSGDAKPLPIRQLIVLPPGGYRLSGRMLDTGDNPARGFTWRVICPGGGDPLAIAAEPEATAGKAWRAFSVDFSVPAANCPAQILTLTVDRGDLPNPVTVWYDDLAIAPAAGVAPKTQTLTPVDLGALFNQ